MRILIVGAGIAGLAMARALARVRIESEVVERTSTAQTAGSGIYLPGNGMAALARLGLAEEVMANGDVVERRRLLDDRDRLLVDFDEAGLWRGVALPVALHRSDLHRILLAGAAGIPIRFGVTVDSIVQGSDVVEARFSDGTAASFDLVVGADGAHSSVRQLAFGDGSAIRPAGQVGWRFVVDGHAELRGWNGWIGRDRGFLALGIGGGRVYCVGDLRSSDGLDPTGGNPTEFGRLFASFAEPVQRFIRDLSPESELWFSPFEEVSPPRWSTGRVVLIGDAAHATAPNLAEGASLAFEDALVLAEALAGSRDVVSSLADFVERRQPRVAWVQRMTHRRDRLRYLDPRLRRAVMQLVGRRTSTAHYRPLLAPP